MKLDIPFFSQLDTAVPTELKYSVCALACVKMVLDSKALTNNFDGLYKEACIVGGREHAGWTHETIVRIFRNHGVHAYRQEFKAHTIDLLTGGFAEAPHASSFAMDGISKIKRSIDNGNPVLISVLPGFGDNTGDHVILVIGYEGDSLIIYDPLSVPESGARILPLDILLKFWKRLTVFVE